MTGAGMQSASKEHEMFGSELGLLNGLLSQQQMMAYYNQGQQMSGLGGIAAIGSNQLANSIQSNTDEHLLVLLCEE